MYVSTAGEKRRLLPLYKPDLEQAIECINDDMGLEVTLQHLHVHQRILVANLRPKQQE
jgi:predicted membrane GTPase involved in stress response